ncbi:MAG: hypothetical protein CMG66_03570 [Candidatus Marinimicrobia bacterium]|nr:hypothetical protein [Candidatus Neomarinimicrobiota bacterium]|tara:strand:+ start:11098 stop:11838 length:741 start_codon:yes stop_codon:yes gene_type:complete
MKIIITLLFINYIFALEGLELAQLVDSRKTPQDIKSTNTMILTNKKGKTKTLELMSISKDNSEKQMIWFLKPAKDKGISFLKIEYEDQDDFMTMWLPGFSRFKRIKSSQKSDSFMGSDLSFEDLTNRTISDYTYKIIEYNESEKWYQLESIPKEMESEYSKHITKILEIEKGIFLAIEEHSYDKENQLLKTKKFDFQNIDSYYIMNKLEVKNVQKNHSTLLTVNDISLNNNYEDSKFIQRSLKIIP